MTTATLADIQAEHARLGAMIAALTAAAPTLLTLPETQIELRPGELYAGLLLAEDGTPSHHLVLLPSEAEDIDWEAAKDWATKQGGELPTRQEQSLLFANLKHAFKPRWYWSRQEHETDGSYAWFQYFSNGIQNGYRKSYEACARAVRRFPA